MRAGEDGGVGVVAGVDSAVQRSAGSALHCRAAGSHIPPPPVGWRITRSHPEGNQLWFLFLRRRILVLVFAGGKAQQRQMHISPRAFCRGMWCVQDREEQFYRWQQLTRRERG